eukprot:CAMPEP_0175054004 /NCGR_PEP_ID=MMETSP0052_2-20121109/9251_1 /TAXON_ID=51329 ORGANISM="Polytomella parva, Strain SAG 63-3" /NCGR_SAMPLE_ID=MMETSP0052_2 /ASSEMBLY_ACC=CAM_ASM_000194 /LENGTH=346 /DNA_ID=CAMNT_0016318625 /DNA_START=12 /DNA_END=1052 /DNA_ORIENTATION=-
MAGLEGSFLVLCNPLLDISSVVSEEFLKKYEIQLANQILAEEKHLPMYKELAALPTVEYMPGGAGQNTARVCQWMLQAPQAASYFGCIGDDEFGKTMTDICKAQGVNVRYQVDPSTPTGSCAVCIVGGERSLVANLAAANNFKSEFLLRPENWSVVERARVVYCTGFFITVSTDSIMAVAKHCAANDKIFSMNISAPFIVQVPPFKAALMEALPYIDFLFGNEIEAEAFAASEGWTGLPLEEVALRIARMPKASGSRPRVVVFTQGCEPTLIAVNGRVSRHPVIVLPKEKLVDTNGAGDAFVGGFMSQLAAGKSVDECVRAGNYAANVIIQRSGCTLPSKPEFVWN